MDKKLRFYFFIGLLLVAAGLLLGSQRLIPRAISHSPSGFTVSAAPNFQPDPSRPLIKGEPSQIDLPGVNISVKIAPGYYHKDSQSWTLSETKAQFATVTVPPNNQQGNTFIYGHNRSAVFARLLDLKPRDKAVVTTANHHTFTYQLVKKSVTKPTDLSLFYYQGPPILTLQTCSGAWFQDRTLFTFNLVKVS